MKMINIPSLLAGMLTTKRNIIYRVAKSKPNIKKYRAIALKAKLHYAKKSELKSYLKYRSIRTIALAFDKKSGNCIGVAITYNINIISDDNFMVFVHKKYRRKKIGTKLLQRIKQYDKKITGIIHNGVSDKFYSICEIRLKNVSSVIYED